VLGDLKVGDGDPSLTLYGADITPNEHKLALQFGVLDNFYDSGEVPATATSGQPLPSPATTTKKRGRSPIAGMNVLMIWRSVADEVPLEHNQPDIDDPGTGFLWDNVAHHGLTYRDYGEFVNAEWCNKPRKAESPRQGTPSAQEAACPRTEMHKGETMRLMSATHTLLRAHGHGLCRYQRGQGNQGRLAQSLRSALSRFQHGLSRPAPRR